MAASENTWSLGTAPFGHGTPQLTPVTEGAGVLPSQLSCTDCTERAARAPLIKVSQSTAANKGKRRINESTVTSIRNPARHENYALLSRQQPGCSRRAPETRLVHIVARVPANGRALRPVTCPVLSGQLSRLRLGVSYPPSSVSC